MMLDELIDSLCEIRRHTSGAMATVHASGDVGGNTTLVPVQEVKVEQTDEGYRVVVR